jgi:S1-C subfamily serine protease
MLEKVIPAVVTLRVSGVKKVSREVIPLADRPDGYEEGPPETQSFRTGGSGVIIEARRGYVLTNDHVIEDETTIDVGLSDGRRFPAKVVGRDAGSDLALLHVEATDLPNLPMGNSDTVRVGDIIVAVGNPFGLEGTATQGIVSALMRTDIGHDSFEDYLQIDAQTNPGNSGGALVTDRGDLVGINTVVAGGRGRGFSIGFAVPINMARTVVGELAKHGHFRRGATGLVVETLSPEGAGKLEGVAFGAVVIRVVANSPAAMHGIKPGDIVLQAANKPVRSAGEFMTREATVPLGGKIPLVIYSGGKKRNLTVETAHVSLPTTPVVLPETLGGMGGVVVGEILPGNPLYGNLRGTQILEVPPLSVAQLAGLEAGDVITRVDGNRTPSTADLVNRIEQAVPEYRIDIVRDGSPRWLRMRQ